MTHCATFGRFNWGLRCLLTAPTTADFDLLLRSDFGPAIFLSRRPRISGREDAQVLAQSTFETVRCCSYRRNMQHLLHRSNSTRMLLKYGDAHAQHLGGGKHSAPGGKGRSEVAYAGLSSICDPQVLAHFRILRVCVCACVRACVRARACARAGVCVCRHECHRCR